MKKQNGKNGAFFRAVFIRREIHNNILGLSRFKLNQSGSEIDQCLYLVMPQNVKTVKTCQQHNRLLEKLLNSFLYCQSN
jgi:hypothetical protein